MIFCPEDPIGVIRKTQTDAEECVRNISTLMKKEEIRHIFKAFHGIFPDFKSEKSDRLEFVFKNTVTREGNINAFSVMSSAVGSHVKRAIFDDFVTINDKVSKADREKTKLMLEEYVNNILAPEGTCGFIGTPWHKLDAWCLPFVPKPLVFDVYKTNFMTLEQIQEKKSKMSNVAFAANYELRLVASDDILFKEPKYARWEFNLRNGIGHLDKKYSGMDTNALTFMCKKNNGRYQGYGKIFHENIKELYEEIYKLWKKYNIGTIHLEDNDDKGFVADKLSEMHIPVMSYHENKNKHVKILNHLKENGFWDLIDWDQDTDPEYLNQILDYTEGSEPDDACDSLSSAGRVLISGIEEEYNLRWKK